MTVQPGWYLDPTGRHRLRYRDDSGWTAWVADDAGAMIDPNGVPTELVPAGGWYTDPGAFRQRWWDGKQWTNRVVGSGLRIRYSQPESGWTPPLETHGTGALEERRRRNVRRTNRFVVGILAGVGLALVALMVAVVAALFLLVLALGMDQEGSDPPEWAFALCAVAFLVSAALFFFGLLFSAAAAMAWGVRDWTSASDRRIRGTVSSVAGLAAALAVLWLAWLFGNWIVNVFL